MDCYYVVSIGDVCVCLHLVVAVVCFTGIHFLTTPTYQVGSATDRDWTCCDPVHFCAPHPPLSPTTREVTREEEKEETAAAAAASTNGECELQLEKQSFVWHV